MNVNKLLEFLSGLCCGAAPLLAELFAATAPQQAQSDILMSALSAVESMLECDGHK